MLRSEGADSDKKSRISKHGGKQGTRSGEVALALQDAICLSMRCGRRRLQVTVQNGWIAAPPYGSTSITSKVCVCLCSAEFGTTARLEPAVMIAIMTDRGRVPCLPFQAIQWPGKSSQPLHRCLDALCGEKRAACCSVSARAWSECCFIKAPCVSGHSFKAFSCSALVHAPLSVWYGFRYFKIARLTKYQPISP